MLIIVGNTAIRLLDTQPVAERYLRLCRIVFNIIDFLITDLLNLRILRGQNRQTAVVERAVSLCLCITLDRLQILKHLICHFIYKIRIDLAALLGLFNIDLFDTPVYFVRERILLLFQRNIALLLHLVEDFLPSLGIRLRMADRIEPLGAFGDARDHGTFG